MKVIRFVLVLLVGGILAYLTYQSKYQSFIFEDVIWAFLILAGLVLFLWTLLQETKNYQASKQLLSFSTTTTAVCFIVVILVFKYHISKDFNKPTLLKVFYDGDYNGTGIDFKTDGTYIFDNSAIGMSDYQYGTYTIAGDKITIDKNELDNVIVTNKLEIRSKQIQSDNSRPEKYLYQVSEIGQIITDATEFRVVLDNRR